MVVKTQEVRILSYSEVYNVIKIRIQTFIIHILYYSQNCMLKMLTIKLFINIESHPLGVRGLKRQCFIKQFQGYLSHPAKDVT